MAHFEAAGFLDGDEESGLFREDGSGIRLEDGVWSVWHPNSIDWEEVDSPEEARRELGL